MYHHTIFFISKHYNHQNPPIILNPFLSLVRIYIFLRLWRPIHHLQNSTVKLFLCELLLELNWKNVTSLIPYQAPLARHSNIFTSHNTEYFILKQFLSRLLDHIPHSFSLPSKKYKFHKLQNHTQIPISYTSKSYIHVQIFSYIAYLRHLKLILQSTFPLSKSITFTQNILWIKNTSSIPSLFTFTLTFHLHFSNSFTFTILRFKNSQSHSS